MDTKLIVITGMVHSGTTILTYLLRQHLQVFCDADENSGWSLESQACYDQSAGSLKGLLAEHDRVLIKGIWSDGVDPLWVVREIPDASILYVSKDFEAMVKSWSKPSSLAMEHLREGDADHQRECYDRWQEQATAIEQQVERFYRVRHADILAAPSESLARLTAWLGLPDFAYDTSLVSPDIDIKQVLGRKIEGD